MESDMADIRGEIYIHLPRSRTRQKISANNKWPNKPKQRAMMRGKWGIPILLQGATNHHLTMRHVNNERSWKIVKIELQLQNAESWKSKHCHAPQGVTPPFHPHTQTHTHTQWKSQRIWKTTGGGEKAPLFFGGGRVKSAYPSANRQQIAMWYTVELMAALSLAPCCRWTAVKIDKMILMNCTWQWNVVERVWGRGKLHILQHQDQPDWLSET